MNSLLTHLQFASTLYLCGLIWTIQLVHYPAFQHIEEGESFKHFHRLHERNITNIVAPVMLVELLTSLTLAVQDQSLWNSLSLASVVLIWIWTFTISVPIHQKLHLGKDFGLIKKLVFTNWLRTGLWSMRAVAFFIQLVDKHNPSGQ